MEGLGLSLTWFLYQLGNFIVVVVALTFLLHKPLVKLLDDRKKEISDSLEAAARVQKQVIESEAEHKAMLEQARLEAQQLLMQTKQQALAMEEKMLSEAEGKASDLLDRATNDIARKQVEMKKELKQELAGLVVSATEKVLEEKVSVKDKQAQIQHILDTLS